MPSPKADSSAGSSPNVRVSGVCHWPGGFHSATAAGVAPASPASDPLRRVTAQPGDGAEQRHQPPWPRGAIGHQPAQCRIIDEGAGEDAGGQPLVDRAGGAGGNRRAGHAAMLT